MTWPQTIFWVEAPAAGRLAVVSRPRVLASFTELKASGIDVLVSLLEDEEAADVGLGDEAAHCRVAGIEPVSVPIADHGVPASLTAIDVPVAAIVRYLEAGRGVGAHCYAGLGRSPLLVAATLIRLGHTVGDAIEQVSRARGCPVPEMDSQHAWLEAFAARRQGVPR